MKKGYKKLLAYGLAAALMVTSMPAWGFSGSKTASAEEGEGIYTVRSANTSDIQVPDAAAEFRDLSAEEITQEAGTGWNLGNTLDAWTGDNYLTGETLWQNVVTTKALIKSVHDMGFNTIRIPVTWGANINDDYSVMEQWMSRVQEIVDYAISEDMYVILNLHHDGARNDDPTPHGWLNVDGPDESFDAVREKFSGLWTTIAERFKNYDEHLIFAAMNEVFGDDPLMDGNDKKHNNDCLGWKPQYGYTEEEKELLLIEFERIAQLNQDFVDVVRASGGNNDMRWIAIQPHNTMIHAVFDEELGFEMPVDTSQRIMMEVHDYDAFSLTKSMNEDEKNSYAQQFAMLQSNYVEQGIPVVIGEYGFREKGNVRKASFEGVGYLLKKYSLIGCAWDNNSDSSGDNYRIIDRTAMKPSDNSVAAILRGFYNVTDPSEVAYETETIPMTEIEVDASTLEMTAGDMQTLTAQASAPADTNDVIVWSTSDANVASVYHGMVRAKSPGTVKITAKALTGTAVKEITVTVAPKELDDPTTDITTNYETIELAKGQETYLTAETNNSEKVRFVSDNEPIVNVSCDGRVLAKENGSANIKVVTSDGYSVTVPVTVKRAEVGNIADQLRLVIRAQYNSGSGDSYYGGSMMGSEFITIKSDGTYTLSLDTAVDLPKEATEKGVTNLNGLGALYIYDYDVASKNTKRSEIPEDTMISYSSIKINGEELLLGETQDYYAVKGSIFDTGNPFNAWEGSVVQRDKFEVKSNSISFPAIENPTKIEITFSVKGYKEEIKATEQPTSTPNNTVAPNVPKNTVAPSANPVVKKPAKVGNVKLKAAKKKMTVTWKKQAGMKYKVAYSTSKAKLAKLKNGKVSAKGVKVVDSTSAKKVIKKLKSKKKYYVKVCAYTTVNGKKTYGKWSAVKNKKIK